MFDFRRPYTDADVQRARINAKGGGRKRCIKGKSCSAACISGDKVCIVELPWVMSNALPRFRSFIQKRGDTASRMAGAFDKSAAENKPQSVNYDSWRPIAEGNYGKVSVNQEGTRAVKQLLTGKDGKKGEFGPHEAELAKKMGELGHSPRVYTTSKDHIEMDVAKGKPLWKSYRREEGEPVMNTAQARQAGAALRDLHKMGFFHGDMHALQFLADGNNLKLVDFGLSGPVASNPARLMQDLAKINSLVRWNNPELASDPYFMLVNKYLPQYSEIKGTSQAAKNKRAKLGNEYYQELLALG